jgi:ubiquitin carboxyl-terminal hydrolase 5/13
VRYRVDAADAASVPIPARIAGEDADGRKTYQEVALEACLTDMAAAEALEYACPACRQTVVATK